MACAANYAWANRQCITHWVREAFAQVLGRSLAEIGLQLVYDVAHNIAKIESTRSTAGRLSAVRPPQGRHPGLPAGPPRTSPPATATIGQPVLIPGDMGRYSFVLVGTDRAMQETFGSTCHGAGRRMSRHAAKRGGAGRGCRREPGSPRHSGGGGQPGGLAEETSEAYKDVAEVVNVCHQAGLCRKVVKTYPIGVVKG